MAVYREGRGLLPRIPAPAVQFPTTASNELKLPAVGVALAGGGSRAAPYAMGVLEALLGNRVLDQVDLASSVSGGSYSTYFLMSRLQAIEVAAQAEGRPAFLRRPMDELRAAGVFRDKLSLERCAPGAVVLPTQVRMQSGCGGSDARPDPRPRVVKHGECATAFPYQAHIRYFQDLLSIRGGWDRVQGVGRYTQSLEILSPILAGTAITLVPGVAVADALLPFGAYHVARMLFDWPIGLSPSADAYQFGIARAYGYERPLVWPNDEIRDRQQVLNEARRFTLGDLARLRDHSVDPASGRRIPYWIANASSGENRYALSWLAGVHYDIFRHVFEMGMDGMGSGEFGFTFPAGDSVECRTWQDSPSHRHVRAVCPASPMVDLSAHEATVASSAFLDANEIRIENKLLHTASSLLLHGLNLDWGVNVENFRVSGDRRQLQTLLPFPLYYVGPLLRAALDQDYLAPQIYLTDGGNAENLGLLSTLRRGTRHVIIADHGEDRTGTMEDVCRIENQIELIGGSRGNPTTRYVLLFPRLADLDQVCSRLLTPVYRLPRRERGEFLPGPTAGRTARRQESLEWLCQQQRKGRWDEVKRMCTPVWTRPGDPDAERGYSPHHWPLPVVTGCLVSYDTAQGARPTQCPATWLPSNGVALLSRLYLLKSAWDEREVLSAFARVTTLPSAATPPAPPGAQRISQAPRAISSCWSAYDWSTSWNAVWKGSPPAGVVPCEAALFWEANRTRKAECSAFPQHSTVWTTLNSSHTVFAALKDLGRWQAAHLDASDSDWDAIYEKLAKACPTGSSSDDCASFHIEPILAEDSVALCADTARGLQLLDPDTSGPGLQ